MTDRLESAVLNLLLAVVIVLVKLLHSRRRYLSTAAFGTAAFACDRLLKSWGFLGPRGLIVARTFSGALIRIPRYCHLLVVGETGSGKSVGLIITNLLDYRAGSVIACDPKGELYRHTASRRRDRGERIIRLAPDLEGADTWNPCDALLNDAMLPDNARALSDALVERSQGGNRDPHWDQKAAQIICAALVYVLICLRGAERSLNSVQEIVSSVNGLYLIGEKLKEIGGIPGRMGDHIHGLYEKEGVLTREGGSVLSTVTRNLSWLDSELTSVSVSKSSFDIRSILTSGTTVYLQIPPAMSDAWRGLLRCWVAAIARFVTTYGSEERSELLILADEASTLNGLSGIEQALVLGRGNGIRLCLAYQSCSQVEVAFPDKPTLLYDNCATKVFFVPGHIDTAEKLSKMLGSQTEPLITYADSQNYTHASGGNNGQRSSGMSSNIAPHGRPLLFPDEIMRLSDRALFIFHRGFPAPILARRIEWFADSAFNPAVPRPRKWRVSPSWAVIALGSLALLALAVRAQSNRTGYWAPEPQRRYVPPNNQQQKIGYDKSLKGRPGVPSR